MKNNDGHGDSVDGDESDINGNGDFLVMMMMRSL